ncbi:MAG: hypothetical protein GX969_05105 [Firmicutes bacterium]|nr:hypothetical protein [Bacillota bacterium]
MSSVIGTFSRRDEAEKAIHELKNKGFDDNKVSIVAREDKEGGADISGGTVTGGAIGGTAGVLAGLGALAIPGIGPIIAIGPIAAGLTGAVAGGLVGSLVDLGIPEDRSRFYENKVKEGKVLAVVEADDNQINDIREVYSKSGASDIEVH